VSNFFREQLIDVDYCSESLETIGQESFVYNERQVSTQQLVSEVLILKLKAEVKSEPESDNDHEVTAALKGSSEPATEDETHSDRNRTKVNVDEQLVCLGCEQTFPHKKNLRHHIAKAVHNGFKSQNGVIKNSYNCLACGKEFEMVTDMDVHLREAHPGETHFPCFYCKKSFTAQKQYQLSFARLCVVLKANYINRQGNDVPTIDCAMCTEKFYEEEQMLCHRISEHVEQEGVEKPKVKQLRCDICKLYFKVKKSFYAHMKEKHQKEHRDLEEMKPGRHVCTVGGHWN
jgi:Zinc finger, C2H2 type